MKKLRTVKKKKVLALGLALLIILNITASETALAVGKRFNMSYIYFANPSTYSDYIARTKDSIDEISPGYFEIHPDGSLKIAIEIRKSFVEEMQKKNIRVVPFLSNHWDRELGKKALQNREALALQIVQAIEFYQLDGIHIDLENLTQSERADYSDFIKILKQRLPSEKILAVAVAANPSGTNTGWQGSYDYAELAKYCDYLMIMAYDEHYYKSAAGPVAGADFVKRSIQYALTKVPAEKIVLGLPFYGRIWADNGRDPQGYGISNSKARELIIKYGGKAVFDKASQTTRATITLRAWDEKPVIGGKSLAAGTYTLWYDSEEALKYKLTLVEEYDILGAGSWSLGQESIETWDYYRLWLNGCRFGDIQGHWSANSVLEGFLEGWIKGMTDTAFMPDRELTRAQAAVILVRALKLPEEPLASQPFDDIKGHWAQTEIEMARRHNLINGVGENHFAPDKTITREEMAVMINNIEILLPASKKEDTAFTDVSPENSPWAFEAIGAIANLGIIKGFPDKSFRPRENLTRAQMAVITQRALECLAAS